MSRRFRHVSTSPANRLRECGKAENHDSRNSLWREMSGRDFARFSSLQIPALRRRVAAGEADPGAALS